MTNKLKLILLLFFWAAIFFVVGMTSSMAKTCSNKVDEIIVEKTSKTMILMDTTGCEMRIYDVRLGVEGKKECEGDMKTPEGTYHVVEKRDSKYYKFLALDYPNAADKKRAKELGCNPGSAIGIHSWIEGLPKEHSQGCITVWTKDEILEINNLVKEGTKVTILP